MDDTSDGYKKMQVEEKSTIPEARNRDLNPADDDDLFLLGRGGEASETPETIS
jgi:hypothetical protein